MSRPADPRLHRVEIPVATADAWPIMSRMRNGVRELELAIGVGRGAPSAACLLPGYDHLVAHRVIDQAKQIVYSDDEKTLKHSMARLRAMA